MIVMAMELLANHGRHISELRSSARLRQQKPKDWAGTKQKSDL